MARPSLARRGPRRVRHGRGDRTADRPDPQPGLRARGAADLALAGAGGDRRPRRASWAPPMSGCRRPSGPPRRRPVSPAASSATSPSGARSATSSPCSRSATPVPCSGSRRSSRGWPRPAWACWPTHCTGAQRRDRLPGSRRPAMTPSTGPNLFLDTLVAEAAADLQGVDHGAPVCAADRANRQVAGLPSTPRDAGPRCAASSASGAGRRPRRRPRRARGRAGRPTSTCTGPGSRTGLDRLLHGRRRGTRPTRRSPRWRSPRLAVRLAQPAAAASAAQPAVGLRGRSPRSRRRASTSTRSRDDGRARAAAPRGTRAAPR